MKKYVVILLSIITVSISGAYINFNHKNNTDSKEISITLIPGASVDDGKEKLYVLWKKEPTSFWNGESNRKTIEELTVKE